MFIGCDLMRELRQKTLLACTDEVHLFTNDQWGRDDFRVKMSRAPGVLYVTVHYLYLWLVNISHTAEAWTIRW